MCDNNGMGQEEQRFQLEQIQRRLREAIRRSGLKLDDRRFGRIVTAQSSRGP